MVSPLPPGRIISPTLPLAADDFACCHNDRVDEVALQSHSLERLIGADTDGTYMAISNVKPLNHAKAVRRSAAVAVAGGDVGGSERRLTADTDRLDAAPAKAEFAMREIVESSRLPLDGCSLSPAIISEGTSSVTGSEMTIPGALDVIVALLFAARGPVPRTGPRLGRARAHDRVDDRSAGPAGTERTRMDGTAGHLRHRRTCRRGFRPGRYVGPAGVRAGTRRPAVLASLPAPGPFDRRRRHSVCRPRRESAERPTRPEALTLPSGNDVLRHGRPKGLPDEVAKAAPEGRRRRRHPAP